MASAALRRFINLFSPLPLPEKHKEKIFHFPMVQQIGIAFMLNILSLAMPVMMLQVYDRIIPHQSYGTLVMLTIGVLTALLLDAVLRIIRSYMVGWAAATHEHAASCAALERASNADITHYERISAGEHLQNFSALGRLREFYSGQAFTALVDLPFVVIFLALIAYLGGALVFVPIALLGLFFVCAWYTGVRLRKTLEARSKVDDRKASFVVSVLHGIHTVKAISMEAPLARRFEKLQGDVTQESFRVALASGSATTLSATFGQLSLIVTATFGCLMVIHGDLSMGGLSACTLLAGRAIQPIQRVLGTWLRLQDLSVSRKQADQLFSVPVQNRGYSFPASPITSTIHVDNVVFSHEDGAPIADHVSLNVEGGEAIAITGSKGSGKSTLLQLMCGLLIPQSGRVEIGNVEPSHYGLGQLSPYIGYIPQQGTIFRGTILENLTGFRMDDESVERALEAGRDLGLDQVVDLLPRGYHTMLSDTAADPVPPGVKQRITLARVFAHGPGIILFDDADRALDKEGYNLLFRMLGRLKGRRTLVLVTQDQNLMSFADRVFHLEQGKLEESSLGNSQNLSILMQPRS